jgi:hypothetical protein
LIARAATVKRSYAALVEDLRGTLDRIHRPHKDRTRGDCKLGVAHETPPVREMTP